MVKFADVFDIRHFAGCAVHVICKFAHGQCPSLSPVDEDVDVGSAVCLAFGIAAEEVGAGELAALGVRDDDAP